MIILLAFFYAFYTNSYQITSNKTGPIRLPPTNFYFWYPNYEQLFSCKGLQRFKACIYLLENFDYKLEKGGLKWNMQLQFIFI